MYLKALELQGFKSFPEKTRICFDHEVTAIVGPNGSGKSNIADALLWVMGEQRTKTLRGGKMEDVIFGGTEKRSPMGFAQVSLVLDNSAGIFDVDSDELTITRRYLRSGESEYYINRENVRLRDVSELLMDTGLGRDGYSVIGQGRIAEIVSAKAADRREVFEEAAGIARYRYRKEEAEHRLERTEENLVRIDDKISELKLQLEPLQKQSETAKKYLLLRDELRIQEISLWMENLDRLHEQSEAIAGDYSRALMERDAFSGAYDALFAEAEELSESMRQSELAIEDLRNRRRQEENDSARLESESAVLRSNIENSSAVADRLRREMGEQTARMDALNEQIRQREDRLRELEAKLPELNRQEESLRQESEKAEAMVSAQNQTLSALLSEESRLHNVISESRSRESLLRENLGSFDSRRTQLDEDLKQAAADRENTAKDAEISGTAAEDARSRLAESSAVLESKSIQLEKCEQSLQELIGRRESLNAELRGIDSRLSLLQELENEYEGFNKAVKTVMREAERKLIRGVHGPVARLIHTDSRYAVAIEIALGAAAQNIVVETQNDGRNAIELLKRMEGGRATFLPLDTIRPSSLNRVPRGEEGFVAVADELVDCDERYRSIVSNLLGRVVISETLEDAIRISNRNNHSLRIVSLDGQQVNIGGSMTGGSVGRSTGILSRANELEKLSGRRKSTAEELEQVIAQGKKHQQSREKLRAELDIARRDNTDALAAESRANAEKEKKELLAAAAVRAEEQLKAEQSSLDAREQDCFLRIRQQEEIRADAESELSSVVEKLAQEHGSSDALTLSIRALEQKRGEIREQLASLRTESSSCLSAAEQLKRLRDDMNAQSAGSASALQSAEEQGKTFRTQLEMKEQQLGERRTLIESLSEQMKKKSDEKLALEARRISRDKETQQKKNELLDRERLCASLEQKKQAAELEEKTLVDRLWDTYELSRTGAQALRRPVESFAKTQKQVSELRGKMSALGNPNLGAIEEYERVSERYAFLSEQKADVEKSKTEIEALIRDTAENMEIIFKERFAEIDAAFRKIFLELFGGGKAALSLDDESRPLECGIDIRIQPPGKALSNISLLSGGEKAFVAIALYFAIMRVRPTPFCVMDEIESALDEANVSVFADALRRMSDETQFIVITHRRGSMEGADELFGVTMQEKGVSTVLQLDMTEAMKTIQQ